MNPQPTLSYEPGVLRILQTKEQTRAYYNKIAKVYDLLSEEAENPMRTAGLGKLAAQPGETILEVGFGTGHCLKEIAEAVGMRGKVLGIDISDQMLAQSKELLANAGLADRVEITRGDAEQLPYEAKSVDGIFFSFTLELFDTPDLPKVLAEGACRMQKSSATRWTNRGRCGFERRRARDHVEPL